MTYQEGLAKLSELEKRLCCSVGPVQPGPWVAFAGLETLLPPKELNLYTYTYVI